jgi:D-3-phosphoglycerate dehydrogenase
MAAAEGLRVICKHGVGTDNIDLPAATRLGIPVLFTPGANTESAAEHTLGLILSLLRKIPTQDRRIRRGVFEKTRYDGVELAGKTLGLIGFGRIGKRVADLVAPFRVNVVVFHPHARNREYPPHVSRVSSPEQVFRESDIISLHCPLTDATRSLVNARTLGIMNDGVFLVNTARGGIISEPGLILALESGKVAGVALDVFEEEPVPESHALLRRDDVILTTHVAGVSDVSLRRMGMEAVQNVLAFLDGKPVDREVVRNPEVLAMGR